MKQSLITNLDFVWSIKFLIALSLSWFDSSIFLNFIAVCSVRTFVSLHKVKNAFSLQSRVYLKLFKASTSGKGILFQLEASRALPIVRDVGLQQSVSLSFKILISNLFQSAICLSTWSDKHFFSASLSLCSLKYFSLFFYKVAFSLN